MRDASDVQGENGSRIPGLGRIATELRLQARSLWPVLLLIYTPVAIAYVILITVRLRTGIAIADFTRDPLSVAGYPPYGGYIPPCVGVMSNVGALIWPARRRCASSVMS